MSNTEKLKEATRLISDLMDLAKERADYHGNGIVDRAYEFLKEQEANPLQPDRFDPETQIAFIWSIEDVQGIDPQISDENAFAILEAFEDHHDGSYEAMWQDLEYHVDEFKAALGELKI